MSTESFGPAVTYTCPLYVPDRAGVASVADRQNRIPGWNPSAVKNARGLLVGAGGICGPIGYTLVRQGVGELHISDPDVVEPSNLARQLFGIDDLYHAKGPALAKNLAKSGFLGTRLFGYALYFREFVQDHPDVEVDFLVVGVDNDRARAQASRWARKKGKPCIFVAVGDDGDGGYVFVQAGEASGACIGCYRDIRMNSRERASCAVAPAVGDVLQVAAGWAAYAVSTLLTARRRRWNLVRLSLASGTATPLVIPKRADCPLCGTRKVARAGARR